MRSSTEDWESNMRSKVYILAAIVITALISEARGHDTTWIFAPLRFAMDQGIQIDVIPVRVIRRDTEEPDNEDHWKNDAPFPKLQYGQKLCMSNIAPGDPFYAQCKKCEKKAGECSGELRDRMRRSPYGDPQLMLIVATSANNENAAVIISKKPRKEAVKDALKECSDGGRFVCRDEVGSVDVYTYKSGLDINKNNCRYVSISEDADQGVHWLSVGGTPREATAGCIVDKRGTRHKCRTPVGACTGV